MTKKKYTRLFFGALCVLHLLIFISFYIIEYLPSVRLLEVNDFAYYTISAIASLAEHCLPLLCAVTVFVIADNSFKKALLGSVIFAIPRFFYLLPYYYLYEIAYGNDSIESLGLASLITVGLIALLALHILLLFLIMKFVFLKRIAKQLKDALPNYKKSHMDKKELASLNNDATEAIPEQLRSRGLVDTSVPIVAAILAAAFFDFLLVLIDECINAVIYLVQYAGSYTPEEIGVMVVSFIFILVKLLSSHLLAVLIKNLACRFAIDSQEI